MPLTEQADESLQRPAGLRGGDQQPNLLQIKDDDELAKKLVKMWFAQDRLHRARREQWKVNKARRAGIAGVMLIKRTDEQEWVAVAPPGSSKQVAALNKADRLCRLLKAVVWVDPPAPDAVPASDSDKDRDSAEFATRALIHLGSEAEADDAATGEQAFDLGNTYGSGFRHWYVEDHGGGELPMAVRAAASVTRWANPQDPKSPLMGPDGVIIDETPDAPYVTKYVRADWSLVDDELDPQVRRLAVPALRCDVLKAPNVRFLPGTARDIWKARGVMLALFQPLGELRARYPGVLPDPASDEGKAKLKKLIGIPDRCEDLLPGGKKSSKAAMEDQELSDDSIVFTVCVYYKARVGSMYPQGFYGCAAGADGSVLLYKGPWYDNRNRRSVDLPLDQFKLIDDEDDPYGKAPMQILGPGNEIRNSQLGSQLEHLDRFNNRKVFYPITSSFQPRAMQAATGTYIPISPGGEPKHEQVPEFPRAVAEMFTTISDEMEHEIGLEAPVTGDSPSSIKSGIHARTQTEQVHVGISDIQRQTIRGLLRGWRIQLQLAAWRFTTPQRISWTGDDGAYKEKNWTGSDLGSTRDVKLQRGTLTMLSPAAKMAIAEQMFALRDAQGNGILSLHDLEHVAAGNVGGMLGIQDNPHRMKVRRQISKWEDGPPQGPRQPPPPPSPPMPGQPPPLVPDPAAAAIWAPSVVDDTPQVAAIRVYEIGRLIDSTTYQRWPKDWRAPVDAEYTRMRQAAGVVTVAEQQAAAQAQQQAAAGQQQAVQQYAQQVQQLQAAVQKQVAAIAEQLAQATEERVGPLEQAIQETQQQLVTLGKALEATNAQIQKLEHRTDVAAERQRTALAQFVAQIEKRLGAVQTDVVRQVARVTGGSRPQSRGMTGAAGTVATAAPKRVDFHRGPDGLISHAVIAPADEGALEQPGPEPGVEPGLEPPIPGGGLADAIAPPVPPGTSPRPKPRRKRR